MRKYLPGASYRNPAVWPSLSNMVPTDRGTYRTPGVFASAGAASPATPGTTLSAWCGLTFSGSAVGYVGTTTKLYIFTLNTFTDKSRGGGYTNSATRWCFTQFGNVTLATNNVDQPQFRDASGAAAFADLAGAPSTAKIVTTQSNCVLFFNTVNGGSHYTISDVGDYTNYTTGDAVADGFISHRPGDITAAIPFKDDVIVFKANSVYRMTYVGGLVKWTISLLAEGIGCLSESDAIVAGDRVIFTGTMGAFSFDGSSFRDLMPGWGRGKNVGNSTASVYWPYSNSVWFYFNGIVLSYNLTSDAWGIFGAYATSGSAVLASYALVSGTPAARLSVLGSVQEFAKTGSGAVIVDLSGSSTLRTAKSDWGAASGVTASVTTHLYGDDDKVTTYSRLTPLLMVESGPPIGNPATSPQPPAAGAMTLTAQSFDSPDGTGVGSPVAVTSSTSRKRFDFAIGVRYAYFTIACTSSYFEIDDVMVKVASTSLE